MKKVVDTFEKVTGITVKTEIDLRRLGDPAVLVAGNDLAKKELAWEPKYNLEAIIDSAWKWHVNYPRGFGI